MGWLASYLDQDAVALAVALTEVGQIGRVTVTVTDSHHPGAIYYYYSARGATNRTNAGADHDHTHRAGSTTRHEPNAQSKRPQPSPTHRTRQPPALSLIA